MKDELLFCPLGGSGEIGMNMNLFGYGQPGNHKWIMVDIGVTFADDTNIQALLQEITDLRQQLLAVETENLNLTQQSVNGG